MKEPIRKQIYQFGASNLTAQNLIGGFRTAQDIIDYHCKSAKGKMHPKFTADSSKKDGKGFFLLDRWPEKIEQHNQKNTGRF